MYSNFTDKELYKKCREIGSLCLKYRKQFLGMIPEVFKRKLYLQYGMHNIYEFAAKLAGVSREVVNEVLRIHRLLNDAPILQEKLVSGEIPYTKLRPVAPIATRENQAMWLEKVEIMSRPTLEVYVREIRAQEQMQASGQLSDEHGMGQQSGILPDCCAVGCGLPWKEVPKYEAFSIRVNPRTAAKMRVFKRRLEKKFKKPLNWDEALQEILKLVEGKVRRKIKKANGKTGWNSKKIDAEIEAKMQKNLELIEKAEVKALNKTGQPIKRYIPAAIRNQVLEKNHGICEAPGCNKPGEIFHHAERFALKPEHNPEKIRYLCRAHEQIAHQSFIKNEEKSPENWQVLTEPDKNHPKYFIDSLVQKFRMGIT